MVLNRVLAEIAKRHAQVKFVKIRAKTAVPDWPDGNLPAAYLYKDGEMRTQLVGSREIATGPPPFTALSVERKLVELGVLAAADVEEDGSEDEEREASHRRSAYTRDDGATWDALVGCAPSGCFEHLAVAVALVGGVSPVHRPGFALAYVASSMA